MSAADTSTALLPLSGRRKAASLCVSLGHEGAAELFRHLNPDLVEQLAVEMAKTPVVEPEESTAVMTEILEMAYARGYLAEGGMRYAREVLERAVGTSRASEILQRLALVIEASPFEFLRG